MSGTIAVSGLISNTDWSQLISDMLNVQKAYTAVPLEKSKTQYQAKLTAWQTVNTAISAITNYISGAEMDKDSGYTLFTSSISSKDGSFNPASVLNVSVGNPSGPGKYSVEVTNLAAAEKIAGDPFSSNKTALGISGDILVNNTVVTIEEADTLNTVAARINQAGAGLTATVLAVSDDEFRLLLESDNTGAEGMSLKNSSSANILESLKLHTASTKIAHTSGNDALSDAYRSSTEALGTILGLAAPQSGTIQIKGTDESWHDVNIDLSSATLESIVESINTAAIPGVTASVEEVSRDGASYYQIRLTDTDINGLSDDGNILETLGIIGHERQNTIRSGADASIVIDTFTITSASNTITDAIEGVTLSLTGTNPGKLVEINISTNSSQLTSLASGLVSRINDVIDYIGTQSGVGTSIQKPLAGDINLSFVKGNITSAIHAGVSENTMYTDASSIGITFQRDGTLSLNNAEFTAAISRNRGEVITVLKSLSESLYEKMNLYIDPYTGTLSSIEKGLKDDMSRIDKRLEEINERLERQRVVLEKKYINLELLISTSNLTKDWLSQQIDYMTKGAK